MHLEFDTAASGTARAAVAGALGGLLAAFAMDQFQRQAAKLMPASGGGDPTTVKAAERVAGPIRPARKAQAGTLVHYGFGAAVGAAYGAAAEVAPWVASGLGQPLGGAVALLADEVAVPATGLTPPPTQSPPSTHAYSLASHLVFGAALEAARRVLLRVL